MDGDLSVEGVGVAADWVTILMMETQSEGRGTRLRLLLLDDHLLFRESLARLLGGEQDFEVVGQFTGSSEALQALQEADADVVLVDLEIAKEFVARYRGKSLVIARASEVMESAIALKRGASGVFLESDSSSRLLQAIRMVANGESWVDQRVIRLLADRFPSYEGRPLGTLTEGEKSVLDGVVDGLSNRKIGTNIGLSESRVKATLRQLFTKAGVRSRSQLVRIALEGGLPAGPREGKSQDNRSINRAPNRFHRSGS
jgi:DNA-binding NarL/FixJ family response regulator